MARTARDPGSGLTPPPEGQGTERKAVPLPPGSIRMGVPGDIDAVFALNKKVFPEAWSHKALDEALSQGFELRVWSATDGDLCAYTLSHDAIDVVHILQLAVAPAFRRRGLARQLTQLLLAEKRREGLKLAYLEVRLSNEPAQALYAGLGFEVTGRRKAYYTPLPGCHEREDALLMTSAL